MAFAIAALAKRRRKRPVPVAVQVEVSALEGLAFFDCELPYPRREQRPMWTTPSASLLVALQPEESLEPVVIAVHHAILCADEVGEQSAKEIVLQELHSRHLASLLEMPILLMAKKIKMRQPKGLDERRDLPYDVP